MIGTGGLVAWRWALLNDPAPIVWLPLLPYLAFSIGASLLDAQWHFAVYDARGYRWVAAGALVPILPLLSAAGMIEPWKCSLTQAAARNMLQTMDSRERMRAAMSCRPVDHIPCSFMLFHNLHRKCATEREFIERQLSMGLDAHAHVGHLCHSMHPEARCRHWIERSEEGAVFCRRIDTPKGALTARVRQAHGWPTEDDFPLFHDWIVPRAEEHLVKPEIDLEKIPYLFGPFRDADINGLRESAREAKETADAHGLYLVGGWCSKKGGFWTDDGIMGADAMSWLSGFTDIMALSLTRPEIVEEYARIIHEWNLRAIGIYLDVTDAELIVRRAWYETTEFWTPASYRRIIAPRLRREAETIHQAGRRLGLIVTSAFLPLLDDILDAGVDVLIGLDPAEGKGTDIAAVKAKMAARQRTIWGGVSGAMTVEIGSEEQTEKAVSNAIRVLGEGGGFILSPVDNVREDTENAWRNTRCFIETWKRLRTTAG